MPGKGHSPEQILGEIRQVEVAVAKREEGWSGYGPEFTSKMVRGWLDREGVKTLFIDPGDPCESGYDESFFAHATDLARLTCA